MYTASDLRKGLKIELENVPYDVVEFEFFKPGKGQAMYKCRIKNLLSGNVMDKTFRAVDKIGQPDLEERELHYSYPEGDHFVFMDPRTYEQVTISADSVGEQRHFLVEDIDVSILFHNGQAIQVTLPPFVEKVIVETEPGVRGDTATNVMKPAKLNTGYELQVPLFINQGDTVRIDTRTGKYFDRVSKG
ncbi:MAG: elongation factor P [Verrucomicrobiota bacterium]